MMHQNAARDNSVYTIDAHLPFAKVLARHFLNLYQDKPEAFSRTLILMPTRRAVRLVKDAFVSESSKQVTILPRIFAIGDLDDVDILCSVAQPEFIERYFEIPSSMPAMQRQVLLAQTIGALPLYKDKPAQCIALSQHLSKLLDHIYTENLDIKDLSHLVRDENLARHWQITLDFLKIISETWPEILKSHDMIDAADRRNRVLSMLATHWLETPPDFSIIGAGSTGSIPSTGALLNSILKSPCGSVILPGVDRYIDAQSWSQLSEDHPQYGLKHILSILDVKHHDVKPIEDDSKLHVKRHNLATEIMRPPETTESWRFIEKNADMCANLRNDLENLHIVNCENVREEATAIALILRQTLEHDHKKAVLITPDRALANRVCSLMKRWDVSVDDSAGQSLYQTSVGLFLNLITEFVLSGFHPVSFLALIKHEYCDFFDADLIYKIDLALRGPIPDVSLDGLISLMKEHLDGDGLALCHTFFTLFEPFEDINHSKPFSEWFKKHRICFETLCSLYDDEGVVLDEATQECEKFLEDCLKHAEFITSLTLHDYADVFQTLMRGYTVRTVHGPDARLRILGQLESRMVDADIVIMGSLNEGTWPSDPGCDPWMSRPMRKDFGLPSYERQVGLAAHDFIQGLCSPQVYITRSKMRDGKPTIPSRWLQRLHAVLTATHIDHNVLEHSEIQNWLAHIDVGGVQHPVQRPAPKPPVICRPGSISVTKVETWLKNPYGIYARDILNLNMLKPIAENVDHSLKGSVLHKILEAFVKEYSGQFLANNRERLQQSFFKIINSVFDDYHIKQDQRTYWLPRFIRIGDAFIDAEIVNQKTRTHYGTEIKGQVEIDGFKIRGVADRLDFSRDDKGIMIIDYKSGGSFSKSDIQGRMPQLSLEGLIVCDGKFIENDENILNPLTITNDQYICNGLEYWVVTGGRTPLKKTILDEHIESVLDTARKGMTDLIHLFRMSDTPYYSYPDPKKTLRFDDYEHLSRIREWGVMADDELLGSEVA